MTQQNDELIAEVWSVRVITTGPVIAFETGLEERAGATALALSRTDDGRNCLDAWFDLPPENALIEQIITAGKMSEYEVDWQVIHHASRDWLAENRRNFPPLTIGRFWIYGSHIEALRPRAKYQLKVDAAQAFGSGTHPTTEGCLLALQSLAKVAPVHAMLQKGRILDMGCGSAILAMAAHRCFPAAKIMAADNHLPSVVTARENGCQNQISPASLQVHLSHGCAARPLRLAAPYQLVFANILAAPLRKLAPHLIDLLAQDGYLILSGLLVRQQRFVMQAYEARGLIVCDTVYHDEWATLVLRRKSAIRSLKRTDV